MSSEWYLRLLGGGVWGEEGRGRFMILIIVGEYLYRYGNYRTLLELNSHKLYKNKYFSIRTRIFVKI